MKRWILLLLVFLLICPAKAQQITELETVLADYMAETGLDESNFSLSYYNTVTGEAYTFNDRKFMIAGSTYKLPLNMYYYEMEWAGEIEPDAYLPRAGVTLDVAHRLSMVDSNNDVSIGMLYTLGEGIFSNYKQLLRKYFTMAEEDIDPIYYADNSFCTYMMMDALKYLYENREDFAELIGYMKQAQQEYYFCAGIEGYEVAHKYGWYDGAVNDVGIVFTEQPFLLAVYTQNVNGEAVLADVARLVTAYNVTHTAPPEPESKTLEVEMIPLPQPELPQEPVAETPPPAEDTPHEETPFPQWILPVALTGSLLLAGIFLATRRKD